MLTSERLSLRPSACTLLGFAAANLPFTDLGWAQTADSTPRELPTVSVEGNGTGNDGFQVYNPSFGKLTEPLVDTPQSITEVPRQLLDNQGVTTMRDALRNVPGISLAAGEAGQQGDNLSIRGFNAQNDFYLDDMRDFGSYFRDPFNLETIEVLKGPASVLFGRGSTGGAINQVSKQPVLAPITTSTIQFGTDGTARMVADVNRPIQGLDGAALRLNVMVNRNNISGRDDAANRRFGFAPELAFGLGTDTRLTLDYFHLQEYDTPDYGLPWLNGRPAPVSHNNFYGYPDNDYFRANVDIGTVKIEHDFNDHITVNDELRYGSYQRFVQVTEPQILGFGPTNSIVNPGIPLSALTVNRHIIALSSRETILDNQTNGTFRFSTGPLTHTVVTGIEVARQTSDPTRYSFPNTVTSLFDPTPIPLTLSPTVTSISGTVINNYGAYAIDTVSIGQHLDLIGGWRWDRFDSTFHQIVPPTTFATRNDDLPTWRGAIVVKPNQNGSIYFGYGTSFDPSAESLSLTAATATLAPEKTTIYELGTKWNLLNQRLSVTGALYQEQKANARETDPNNPTAQILAGNYRVRGFEIGATGHLTDRWSIFGGYSYNYAIVVSSPNPNEVGHTPPNAPRHTLTAWTEYHLPWYGIEIGGGINFVSARTASSTPVAGTNIINTAPGYWTMGLMAKYPITPNLSLQANVTNVTNTYYYDQLHPAHVILGPSRAALFSISAKL